MDVHNLQGKESSSTVQCGHLFVVAVTSGRHSGVTVVWLARSLQPHLRGDCNAAMLDKTDQNKIEVGMYVRTYIHTVCSTYIDRTRLSKLDKTIKLTRLTMTKSGWHWRRSRSRSTVASTVET